MAMIREVQTNWRGEREEGKYLKRLSAEDEEGEITNRESYLQK